MKIAPRTVVITGSTSGIGKATAKILAEKRYRLILVSRDLSKLEQTRLEIISATNNQNVHIFECDFSSQKSIRNVTKIILIKYPRIDVLINNAGIHVSNFELTENGIEKTFAVNHLGYFLLTGLLLKNIKKSKFGQIINVSSDGHRWIKFNNIYYKDGNKYNKYMAYRKSKLANLMFTFELAKRLKNTNIRVNSLHPGLVYTNIGMEKPDLLRVLSNIYKKYFAKAPEQGAETIVYLVCSEAVKATGKYFVNKLATIASKEAYDAKKQKVLWNLSEELTGYSYNDIITTF